MYYAYVLQSEKDMDFYVGFTKDLKLRFDQHDKGIVESTKDRRPLKLIYYEACLDQRDATKREKYLKTYHGKMFLKRRLKSYLTGWKGYGRRRYKQEFIRFLTYAIASNDETVDHLETLYETKSLSDEPLYQSLHDRSDLLGKKLNLFIQSVGKGHMSEK